MAGATEATAEAIRGLRQVALSEPQSLWAAHNAVATGASRPSGGSDKIRACPPTRSSPTTTPGLSARRSPPAPAPATAAGVRELVAHLDAADELSAFLARDGEDERRAALGDWRRRLVDRGLAPSTVNLALAAATSLLDSRALPAPRVPRVEIDPAPPRALTPEQVRAVEREIDRLRSSRDRAIMELLLCTGLPIGELADLDTADVRLTQRTGELIIRHGKGDRRRIVPLNRSARAALRPWLTERLQHPSTPARDRGALTNYSSQ